MNSSGSSAVKSISLSFEGREIRCQPGVSIAAALTGAGELELREAATEEKRGLFCGMGVCQECRVIVDGQRSVRACMTPASAGLQILKEKGPVSTAAGGDLSVDCGRAEILTPDVLVIGAGPGGLVAASVAAEAGAEVVVLDERPIGGGQYYKQPSSIDHVPESLSQDRQFSDGKILIERAMRSGARVLLGNQVWGAFVPNEFAVFDGEQSSIYKPKRTIVASGAHERGLPIPGWTLPGVMTTGAAQSMLRNYGTLPGQRILIAGNGPLNLQVALELFQAGAEVFAVAELAKKPGVARFFEGLRMGLTAPGLMKNGIHYLIGLRRSGVPVLYQQGLASVEKTRTGLRAWTGRVRPDRIDAENSYDVDIVCMGYGFQPNNEILRCLGCRHSYDEYRGQLVTDRSSNCETSVAGVYAIGDCCGLGGAPAALQDGVIAATAAVESLQLTVSPEHRKEYKRAVRNLRRHQAFQTALWKIFAAPRFQTELANPDTLICRCENVCLKDIEKAINDNSQSIGAVKRHTRLGMGPCQGRYCAPLVADLLAKRSGHAIDEFSFFAPRSPLKPLRIADIVSSTKST